MQRMEQEQCLINGVDEKTWASGIDGEVHGMSSRMPRIPETEAVTNNGKRICRLPLNVREKDESFLYTPRIISFGPYNHDRTKCKSTIQCKKKVLLHSLKRSKKKLGDHIEALKEVVQSLKDEYDDLDSYWQENDHAFFQLMIYDGFCFLEVLRDLETLDGEKDFFFFDPQESLCPLSQQILAEDHISENVLKEDYKHDMLLLENQLPMKLLVKLASIQTDSSAASEELYIRMLKVFNGASSPDITEVKESEFLHVLDLCCAGLKFPRYKESMLENLVEIIIDQCWLLDAEEEIECASISTPLVLIGTPFRYIIRITVIVIIFVLTIILNPLQVLRYLFRIKPATDICVIIPSVTELYKVGIGIKMRESRDLIDISFESEALWLPKIYVDGLTQSRFLNMIVFEQLHPSSSKSLVTSYIYFMSRLLQGSGDVRLLQLRGIIHTLWHADEVVKLFKSLTKDIQRVSWQNDSTNAVSRHYYWVSRQLAESFYGRMNNPWQRDLWQTYLNSPWAVISIIAAFFLFTFTSLQTIYTMLSYYNSK